MVRRYEESIEVRAGVVGVSDPGEVDPAGGFGGVPGPAPSAFLWRGRLYVVRDVIGHWRERRAWWRGALDPDEEVAAHGLDCLEQEVWRVEASPGRLAGIGVYDLGVNDLGVNDLGANDLRVNDLRVNDVGVGVGVDGPTRGWRLLRVAD